MQLSGGRPAISRRASSSSCKPRTSIRAAFQHPARKHSHDPLQSVLSSLLQRVAPQQGNASEAAAEPVPAEPQQSNASEEASSNADQQHTNGTSSGLQVIKPARPLGEQAGEEPAPAQPESQQQQQQQQTAAVAGAVKTTEAPAAAAPATPVVPEAPAAAEVAAPAPAPAAEQPVVAAAPALAPEPPVVAEAPVAEAPAPAPASPAAEKTEAPAPAAEKTEVPAAPAAAEKTEAPAAAAAPSKRGKFSGLLEQAAQQPAQKQAKKEKDAGAAKAAKGSAVKAVAAVPQAAHPRNLVFVTSEVAPWSKTGGLGDVLGSLPIALAARGHRVMVVVPRYANYDEPVDTGVRVHVMGAEVGLFHHRHKGVDWVFVDHPSYPRPGGVYADEHGVYGDNQFRFMLLALAGLEAPLQLPLPMGEEGEEGLYGQECVFIANDWHAALVPVYLAAKYRPHGVYTNARSIMAIHNLRHQGVFSPTTYKELGLPGDWYSTLEYQYPPHLRQGSFAEEGRSINMLKGGLTVADRIVTVSPGYAEEIRSWLGGWGLEGMLTARGPVLNGIVNGIDVEDWNPRVDAHLPVNYGTRDFKAGKAACKAALQKELGLPVKADTPLIAFIGRLDYQKGADIVLQAAPWMMSEGVQLVCLGTGSPDLENGLRWLEAAYPEQARGWVGFNVAMSHKMTAAADILLMPSRFEPCGLNQLYAMAYGTVPVAHRTGGLRDTVVDFNPEQQSGTGWTFDTCDASGLMHATGLALHTLREYPKDFEGIQQRGMERDSSWNGAAEVYENVFDWACFDQPFA